MILPQRCHFPGNVVFGGSGGGGGAVLTSCGRLQPARVSEKLISPGRYNNGKKEERHHIVVGRHDIHLTY